MKKWFNKEYTIRRKVWMILLEAFIDTLICTVIFYFSMTDYNSIISYILNVVKTYNIAFKFSIMFFPAFLIVIILFKFMYFVINNEKNNSKKKKKK